MKIVVIDTATSAGLLVLGDDGRVVKSKTWGGPAKHAEVLADSLANLLCEANWAANDIEAVGVALGPGSFTGLRIGLATAKGLAAALSIPIAGYYSLLALAMSHQNFDGIVVPAIDARRKELYAAAYDFRKKNPELMPALALAPGTLLDWIGKNCDGDILLVGDGAALYSKELEGQRRTIIPDAISRPDVALSLTVKRIAEGGDDINRLVPSYVRLSDAEIGFKGFGGG